MARKAIRWLHLSDIHFSPRTCWRDNRARIELLAYLKSMFESGDFSYPDFIVCTGDIAFGEMKGMPLADQYQQARDFFDALVVVCGNGSVPFPMDRLFVVPGNHDINRELIDPDAQRTLVEMANDSREHVATINARFNDKPLAFQNAIKRLDAYGEFVKSYLPHQHDPDFRHFYTKVFDIDGFKIGLAGFNSAWSCSGAEDDRHVWFAGEWQFNKAHAELANVDLRLGIVHHPIDWFPLAEQEAAEFQISNDFDFWLHGHMHNAWVTPVDSHICIGAGAISAETKDEFGFNLVQLDFENGAEVHLHRYSRGWTIHPIPGKAPKGIWLVPRPKRLRGQYDKIIPLVALAEDAEQKAVTLSRQIFGRDSLILDCVSKLNKDVILLVFGMRGNGKTSVIEALAKKAPLAGKSALRVHARYDTTANDLFRDLAPVLGEMAEFPVAPRGGAREICAELLQRYPAPRPMWLWFDRAHMLLQDGSFRDSELRNLLLGLHLAYRKIWNFVFELRERPPHGLLGQSGQECEVPGIDRDSMGEYLAASSPAGMDWRYTGNELKRVFGWIGAGGGKQAHPLTLALLIEVARGYSETPIQVLERHSIDFEKRLEESLLGDLINNVLNQDEQSMIETLALYRNSVPHDHADWLEEKLQLRGSWDGLDRRCLLVPDAEQNHFYLHSFISSWLRRRIGYSEDHDEVDSDFVRQLDSRSKQIARRKQLAIAECWLKQLGSGKRKTRVNIERALEAFYHLSAAGVADRVPEIAVDLLSGKADWAIEKIESLHTHLFKNNAPVSEQRKALEFWVVLDPLNSNIRRYLGEAWVKEEGRRSEKALASFEEACRLDPSFGPHWANLGASLLSLGQNGALEFIRRIEELERTLPQAITETVDAVRANCLEFINDADSASILRMNHIRLNSKHTAFYADEAQRRLIGKDFEGALQILSRAEQNNCSNDYTTSILAEVLQSSGKKIEASAVRLAKIEDNSRNSIFYCAEAGHLLDDGRISEAIEILNRAKLIGAWDEKTRNVWSRAIRMEKVS